MSIYINRNEVFSLEGWRSPFNLRTKIVAELRPFPRIYKRNKDDGFFVGTLNQGQPMCIFFLVKTLLSAISLQHIWLPLQAVSCAN